MAKLIVGNASAITVPRQDRNTIRRCYCDVLGGKIVKEGGDKDICRLEEIDFGTRKIDIPSGLESVPYLYFQAPGGQCFQLLPINEGQKYYKGGGNGPNVAEEKQAEALKEKAMSELALGHYQKNSTRP